MTWRDRQVAFYKTKRWQALRDSVIKERGGLCERCLERGIFRPAVIAHHIKPLSATNIDDPEIALNSANLKVLCRECHDAVHSGTNKRYTVDAEGHVTIKGTPL